MAQHHEYFVYPMSKTLFRDNGPEGFDVAVTSLDEVASVMKMTSHQNLVDSRRCDAEYRNKELRGEVEPLYTLLQRSY